MNFSDLIFDDHPGIRECSQAIHFFENDWGISVVTGPDGYGLLGVNTQDTYEVAVYRPNGYQLEEVLGWQTPVQVTSLLHLLEML